MTFLALVIVLIVIPAQLTAGIWPFKGCRGEDERQMQQKIAQEGDPVAKAKCQIQLARLKLVQGMNAYDNNSYGQGRKLLTEYLRVAQDAWSTLKSSGRNAVKSPNGFKDLDISLRENGRLLGDLAHRVPYPQDGSIEDVIKKSTAVHDEVLDALFPTLRLHRPPAGPAPPAEGKAGVDARGPE
jgi:hypothetical protein